MIKVMIHNGERNSLVTEFPTAHLKFEEQLHSLGVWNPQGDIFPSDNEDEAIRVKLWSDDTFGNILLGAVKETDSLRSINTMCRTVCYLKYSKFLELKEKLSDTPPESIKDVFAAVKTVNTPTVSFKLYSPLEINMEVRNEYGDIEEDYEPILPKYATAYESIINSAILKDLYSDSETRAVGLAPYIDDDLTDKIKSAFPSVEDVDGCLYGVLSVEAYSTLTEDEMERLKEGWSGQMSDGWGEGFEQHPIMTDDGDILVSFWHSGDDYSVFDEDEFQDYLADQDGGMKL